MIGKIELPEMLRRDAEGKWQAFSAAAETAGCPVPDDAETVSVFKRVFAFSDFVAGHCARFPDMAADLLESGDLQHSYPPGRYNTLFQHALSDLEEKVTRDVNADLTGIRKILRTVRRREMVRIGFRDLAAWADLTETMLDLSAFADGCLAHTLNLLYQWHCRRHGTPVGPDGNPQQLVILAMGKLGARELNFSSDIDLIFAYPEAGETKEGPRSISNEEFFAGLCRQLIQTLSTVTADGMVFRVDMGLRPFGESGPIAMSFDAMETYYQTQGREWERYAWIKARVAAGDKPSGDLLLERLKPFVYRRYFDFGVFESLREMKRKISQEVRKKGMAGNIKLGAGGIREIEFFGQMFQLIRGGVVRELQQRSIQKVLKILGQKGYVPKTACDELLAAYAFLRNTENRLQAFSDRQTHDLPTDPVQRDRLAASMAFPEWEAFFRQLNIHMNTVHGHFENLLRSEDGDERDGHMDADLAEVWLGTVGMETGKTLLAGAGFDSPEKVLLLLENLRNAPATRALSMGGRKRLDHLMPMVLKAVGAAGHPVPALNRIIELIKTIEQRTSYLALLLENPATLSHLVKFSDLSPWIISYMARHPVLLDELLDPRTLYRPPGKEDLEEEIVKRLGPVADEDLEIRIEELCIFKQINTLRVAAADVSGALPLMKVSDRLSWIAETILDRVLAFAWHDLVEKHGIPAGAAPTDPYGRGFVVIAYGKLGGLELGYDSDLDLVFLHAGGEGVTVGGSRPMDTDQFYARLGQRMVHMLTAHTRAGKLYDTDMRLRPSGSSGPLVSQIDSFRDYQINDAWTWENQAIVRARAICGDPELARRFEVIRKEVLARPRDREILRKEVSDMRERLRRENHRSKTGVFHLKQDRGGMVDIEFLAQYLVLLKSHAYFELTRWSDNVRILESLTDTGVLDKHMAYLLKHAYLTYRAAAHRLSLQEKPAEVSAERFGDFRKSVLQIWDVLMGK